jgi:Fe2+ or Zn2+ uptake regulation protein
MGTHFSNGPSDQAPQTPACGELRAALESAGWRYTRQRAAVYDFLKKACNHPNADEVYAAVKRQLPSISLATVYKALEALVSCSLASKLTYSDGSARYDCRSDDHYHLRCQKTGRVQDLKTAYDPNLLDNLDPTLRPRLEADGFHVTGYRLEVTGYYDHTEQASPQR